MRLDSEFCDEGKGFFSVKEMLFDEKVRKALSDNEYSNTNQEVAEYTSKDRETILEWYEFKESGHLLELGGAYGALTGLFLRKCEKVTTVENKGNQCEIIRKRWQNYEGRLEVVHQNPVLFETDEKYDYIVIHEIWGFIKKLNKTENAYEVFLRQLNGMLKPQGHILIVTDNRIGLKYFSGALDEYTKKLFIGVDGYKNYTYVRTFSLSEIQALIEQCDLNVAKVYYTVSDWHFADRLYTKQIMNSIHLSTNVVTSYAHFSFFDLSRTYMSLQENGVADVFADSFILDISENENDSLIYFEAPRDEKEGYGVFKNDNSFVKKRYLRKTGFEMRAENIDLDWYESVNDDKLTTDGKKFLFPYIDEADIMTHGYHESAEDKTDNQLVEEQKMIDQFIREVFENADA